MRFFLFILHFHCSIPALHVQNGWLNPFFSPTSTFLKFLEIVVRLSPIVQVSSPHKCGQRVSYRAFNAVVVAFPQIFSTFLLPYPFLMLIFASRIAQSIIPDVRPIHLTSALLSRGECCPQTHFLEPLELDPSATNYLVLPHQCFPVLGLLNVLEQGPRSNTLFWASHPHDIYIYQITHNEYVQYNSFSLFFYPSTSIFLFIYLQPCKYIFTYLIFYIYIAIQYLSVVSQKVQILTQFNYSLNSMIQKEKKNQIMQFIFDLVFLIDYADYFLTHDNIKIIYR